MTRRLSHVCQGGSCFFGAAAVLIDCIGANATGGHIKNVEIFSLWVPVGMGAECVVHAIVSLVWGAV